MSLVDDYRGMRQVELVDVVVDLPSTHPTVVLRDRDDPGRELWFPIGQAEGVALAMAWRELATPRPLTHELFTDVMAQFGIEVDVVRITSQSGRTYLAELVLSKDGERRVIPCRPSDGLTVALRQPRLVPVMVAEELLMEVPHEEVDPGTGEGAEGVAPGEAEGVAADEPEGQATGEAEGPAPGTASEAPAGEESDGEIWPVPDWSPGFPAPAPGSEHPD